MLKSIAQGTLSIVKKIPDALFIFSLAAFLSFDYALHGAGTRRGS